ncbi:hypothetical protein [Erwinia sp.]|uniref:hypothetical protein n=1 Tax=Erwinia citreus TaxID=558 RepID=UPI003C76C42D
MKKIIILANFLFIFSSYAAPSSEECLGIDTGVTISMTNTMIRDFGIKQTDLLLKNTKVKLLHSELVSYTFADYLAKKTLEGEIFSSKRLEGLRKMYMFENVRNLVFEVIYENKEKKHNTVIASALVDDTECSVSFEGYLIVKKEF